MDVALITSPHLPNLDKDDQLLHQALHAMEIDAQVRVWSDATIDWGVIPLCVIRSTWDYHRFPQAYRQWVDHVSSVSRLLNPKPVVLWNMAKTYLNDIAAWGFPTIPTIWLTRGECLALKEVMMKPHWEAVVIKPCVSASGDHTHRIASATEGQPLLDRLVAERDMMIQPYLPSVETEGEYSLVYINKRLTHAVQKKSANGEFRIHEEHGGSVHPYDATFEQQQLAEGLLDWIERLHGSFLYARVDFIQDQHNRLCISEVELIEPSLHLAHGDNAAKQFAQAIAEQLQACCGMFG